ncbi:ATP-dependent zinc metalloprotease FtsH [Papillibacter cinnamivorans]|uniref:ATP-dependent zinc metalloprotease FtsH n=1 Tax=Papillibacter cinnamivorans DSM 12816 TaxID=1122930 RepID=A0A1W2CZR0_9FIRM|nr:ATP-dependent zinc metalloprotease FtsH [Papillibacter cinnamivorans]SMC90673.1 cell division protease FtsH [Papillibacter cinnamivorans DSM 12816]
MKKSGLRDLGFYILIFFILISVVFILFYSDKTDKLQYSEVRRLFEQEKVESFKVEGSTLTLSLREPLNGSSTATYELYSFDVFYDDLHELIDRQVEAGIIENYDYDQGFQAPWWSMFLPYVFIFIVFGVLWYFMFSRSGAAGSADKTSRFSKARTTHLSGDSHRVTFADVAGADEEKAELQEIVEFLKNPKRFIDIGARIPKGVLLVGPPGTGKTLIAKAVAGEAGVQFLSISGSDFVELYVGVGASRVRDLFDQAKKVAPSIVFIDEIDAVGRQRGTGLGGGHDEREQTLNQLLVEMDGFGSNEGVIVLAATNRQDILDPALLRPGRFDRQVYVGLPDIKGREEILKVHVRGKPLAEDVDLSVVAKSTAGFTGADLENLVNESALLAARRGKRFITMPEFQESMIKVIAGPEKKSRVIPPQERRLSAYHEAGHALVIHSLPTHDPVHQISIIPRGLTGGMTISLPREDRSFLSKSFMIEQIVSLLGGRVAEKLVLDDISTGASNDIQRASAIARKMVAAYGMSDKLGTVSFESGHDEVFIGRSMAQTRSYSEEIAAEIDKEVKAIIDEAYRRCEEILRENLDKLHLVAEYLLEFETMDSETFQQVFSDSKAVEAMMERKKKEKAQTTDEYIMSPPPPGIVNPPAPKPDRDPEPPDRP